MAKKIILGVTGGMAAYKTPDLARGLKKLGMDVHVIMTRSAEQFVTPTALRAVSGNRVLTWNWDVQEDPYDHLNVVRDAAAALVAPATGNFLGKLAHGVADDLLLTSMLALKCPLYVSPSMNPAMLSNQAVLENIKTLEKRGVNIIPPESGEMACGDTGEGRLPSIESLVSIIAKAVGANNDYAGRRVVVTAGPTEEPIDAARFISNRSSGKMGVALAQAALERGAEVTLVHGPLSIPAPKGVAEVAVRRAEEMFDAVKRVFEEADMLIMAAAVADFRPAVASVGKTKKGDVPTTLTLEPNPDILAAMGEKKGRRIIVGFAAETGDFLRNAREKMAAKNMDMICVNDVGRTDIGFDSDFNEISIIGRRQEPTLVERTDKYAMANRILDEAVKLFPTAKA
ncbi:MAG: bifunctional phosphopantothenoylcysteine decarboxylase/phosphopantothenate--cysteine ligase CoaBC [Nitrospinae bacterium]|nr:bifunctional phosphopantothenoylcysteine decarboxylase/phosphopantothenate--cysteine ligase CoaBC [Nitrospinota bacterium]